MPTKAKALDSGNSTELVILAPRIATVVFDIVGTAPYVQLAFGEKAVNMMSAKMTQTSKAKGKAAREARDFDDDYRNALHRTANGRYCIPAGAFRNAMISACRLVGFKMTLAKLSVFVEADDVTVQDGMPCIYIEGEPEPVVHHVRNANGAADLRVRGMWREWSATLRVRFDQGQFSAQDVANLIERVGLQVGIGEGRPDSKNSAGLGWGTFRIARLGM